jgi:uncharacterized protein (DUF2252 family)
MDMSLPSAADRRARLAAGAAVRRRLPRSAHAAWSPPATRADPLDILRAQDRTRIAELLPIRYARMRASAFAFLRGSAAIMAADLATQPHTDLVVQLCGDAHLANFGAYPSPEGRPIFDVNDFDETMPGPFEWDLKRLAASLAVCGRDAGMDKSVCRGLAARAARHYRRHIARMARLSPFEAWHSSIDLGDVLEALDDEAARHALKKHLRTALRAHGDLFGLVHLTDAGPRIRDHGTVKHSEQFRPVMEAAFAAYRQAAPPPLLTLFRHYRLTDTAFKVVGVGSVGTFCALGLFVSADGDALLLQAKQAQASVLEAGLGRSLFAHQGERVAVGQLMTQAETDIFLGVPPGKIDDRFFYVRRLKDPRMAEIGTAVEAAALPFTATLCGRALARAHARTGDAAMLAGYLGEGESFDDAIAAFAMAYAEQNEADFKAFCGALDAGRFIPTDRDIDP